MANAALGSKAEGSIIKIKENGVLVDFFVAKQNYESGLNGSGRVLVVRKDCYDRRRWHSSNVNAYATCTLDAWFNGTYKNLLDADIRTVMGTTKFYYTPGNGNKTKTTLERAVFALSATELGKKDTYLNTEGTALSSTVINLLKIAKLNGSAVVQLTRSPTTVNTVSIYVLGTAGGLNENRFYCNDDGGSRPTFTLPSDLLVSDDGSVTTNTAPSTPESISIPESVQGGTSIAVSWSAADDAESNLEGYVVERSTDGGGTWTQVYQGSATQTDNTVPAGSETVMYRVRAYDSQGLYSGYRNSAQVSVFNNDIPFAPSGITVPEAVLGGGSLIITWGAATDPDNNLTGYELERQVDGGDWTQIYKGADLSYTDSITRGWTSVNYRVRACDAYNAVSAYTTGTARTVNNNRAPAIVCDTASGTDLGKRSDGFSISYSVGDEDGDSVTVTEAIDGVALRTFTATAGAENTFDLTGDTFFKVLNGAHVLTITAGDGQATTVHKLTFTKEVTEASVTLAKPMEADAPISICVVSVAGSVPEDAEYTVEVTNNANDDAPVWEDCTVEVKNGGNHVFTNESAAKGFAFNFRVHVKRGLSGVGGYINSVQGGFQ